MLPLGHSLALRKFPGPWAERAGTVKVHPPAFVLVGWSEQSDAGGFFEPNSTGASLRGPRPQCMGTDVFK